MTPVNKHISAPYLEDLYNYSALYGVELYYSDGKKIHYEIECGYGTSNPEVFRMNRKQLFINNQVPDLCLYEIADQMGKAFYPIKFTLDDSLQIKKIINYEEIADRCQKAEKQIVEYYKGDITDRLIQKFHSNYRNTNNIRSKLQNELFFQLYFLPIYGQYDGGYNREVLLRYQPGLCFIEHNLEIKIDKYLTSSGKTQVYIESKEKISNQPYIKAKYKLLPDNHCIYSMQGAIHWHISDTKLSEIQFQIFLIDFSCQKVNHAYSLIMEEHPSNNQRWWNIFKL